MNEATARIRINALLAKAGWRFFPDGNGPANISLEHGIALKPADLNALGDDFERTERGVVDFLLLDDRGFPLVVLEAKSESKQPLVGKEQARQVRGLPELPVRDTVQWQPALLLGPGTRQSPYHHRLSHARIGRRLSQGRP